MDVAGGKTQVLVASLTYTLIRTFPEGIHRFIQQEAGPAYIYYERGAAMPW